MGQYDKKILNALLDSYENSLLSRGENKVAVHVAYAFTKKNIPEYFNESSLAYEEIHSCVKELEQKRFLEIVWKNGRESHIVQKVLLNENVVQDVYQYLKRIPKSEKENSALQLLVELQKKYSTPVAGSFIQYLMERIVIGKSVKEFAELSNLKQMEHLIRAVACIEENQESCYIREFSIRCFGDSKIFEEMLGKIGKVWRNFSNESEHGDAYAVLAEHFIYSTPNYVYLKGTGIIELENQQIDLEVLHQGIGLSGEDLQQVHLTGKSKTKKVITIENLTTFFRWKEEDALIIYLGGYHNSLRRELLKMVYAQLPNALYLHFGDIDVGGFEIYEDLCAKTGIPFTVYHMGVRDLKKYRMYTKKLTANDRRRLKLLMEKNRKCDYMEVLEYMILNDVKLEQECIRNEKD